MSSNLAITPQPFSYHTKTKEKPTNNWNGKTIAFTVLSGTLLAGALWISYSQGLSAANFQTAEEVKKITANFQEKLSGQAQQLTEISLENNRTQQLCYAAFKAYSSSSTPSPINCSFSKSS